ncbi:MAG: hypothetical protein GKR87_07750 [Kiritimatiellae bacterium]|nr:hypothetical protein [Kiritimatiellia bacterium]
MFKIAKFLKVNRGLYGVQKDENRYLMLPNGRDRLCFQLWGGPAMAEGEWIMMNKPLAARTTRPKKAT